MSGGHVGPVGAVGCFDLAGVRAVLSCGAADHSVVVWDLAAGEERGRVYVRELETAKNIRYGIGRGGMKVVAWCFDAVPFPNLCIIDIAMQVGRWPQVLGGWVAGVAPGTHGAVALGRRRGRGRAAGGARAIRESRRCGPDGATNSAVALGPGCVRNPGAGNTPPGSPARRARRGKLCLGGMRDEA